ncbi:ribonuclease III [Gammaproteobacteria bacterium]|jgi:ribonuclease-3|nr:ribonuclease III [Gammaproteobacteria bacterium]
MTNTLFPRIDYEFKDDKLIELALTHKSLSTINNERLEFLGDAVLNLYVSERLFDTYENLKEGKLTRFKASIVSRENLQLVATEIGLSNHIKLGKGETLEENSILGNVLEAIIGAIFLDSSYARTIEVLDKLFQDNFLELVEEKELKDSKSTLQELLQKKYKSLPRYSLSNDSTNKVNKHFQISCFVDAADLISHGEGKTRKKAELDAARNMLKLIESQ